MPSGQPSNNTKAKGDIGDRDVIDDWDVYEMWVVKLRDNYVIKLQQARSRAIVKYE